jgi:hypothetical protein
LNTFLEVFIKIFKFLNYIKKYFVNYFIKKLFKIILLVLYLLETSKHILERVFKKKSNIFFIDVFRNLKKILNTFFKDLFEVLKNLPLLLIIRDIEFFFEMQEVIITSLVKKFKK